MWNPVTLTEPAIGEFVLATDGVCRWLDSRHKALPTLDFHFGGKRHIATHYFPLPQGMPTNTQPSNG